MSLGLFHYQLLTDVLEKIHYIYDEAELAKTILSGVASALNAEGGSIFKIVGNKAIIPLASYGAPLDVLKKHKFVVGKGVVGWVAEYAQPVKVDNPMHDKRFLGAIDTSTGFKTSSIVAAPILSRGQPVGVIEFLNRRGGPFAAADLELVSMVGREIGIAFANLLLIERLEETRAFDQTVIENLSAGVLVVDRESRLRRMNPGAQKMLGLDFEVDGASPQAVQEVLKTHPELTKLLAKVAAAGAPVHGETDIAITGKPSGIRCSGFPILNKDGARLGSALLMHERSAA